MCVEGEFIPEVNLSPKSLCFKTAVFSLLPSLVASVEWKDSLILEKKEKKVNYLLRKMNLE